MPSRLIRRTRIGLAATLLSVSACAPGARDASSAEGGASPATPTAESMRPSRDTRRDSTFPLPRPVGYVNDFAGVVPGDVKRLLTDTLQRVQESTGGEIVLVTLPSLSGFPVAAIARRIGNEWGVGARAGRARDAGVVVLIVPKETSTDGRGYCRIELGTGAAAFISDSAAASICRSATPAFRLRDYGDGLRRIALDLARRYAVRYRPP